MYILVEKLYMTILSFVCWRYELGVDGDWDGVDGWAGVVLDYGMCYDYGSWAMDRIVSGHESGVRYFIGD